MDLLSSPTSRFVFGQWPKRPSGRYGECAKEVSELSGSRLRRQAGNGSGASVVAVFAMVLIVLVLLLAWWGFFGGGHWFGPSGGNGINVTVHQSP
jgi:hypothetical protein